MRFYKKDIFFSCIKIKMNKRKSFVSQKYFHFSSQLCPHIFIFIISKYIKYLTEWKRNKIWKPIGRVFIQESFKK